MRKLRVGPHTYTVAFVPNVDDEEHVASARGTDEPEELFGLVIHKLLEIHVGLNMRGTQQAEGVVIEDAAGGTKWKVVRPIGAS